MITAKIVQENKRLNFLPSISNEYIKFEGMIYHYMEVHATNYDSGYWEFVELSNGGKFLYPTNDKPFRLINSMNHFDDELSPEAAGICITILLLSDMCMAWYQKGSELSAWYNDLFLKLNQYALQHNEASKIQSFLD